MEAPTEEESIFENKIGLAKDMKRLGKNDIFCDVKFLVGKSREPIYGVKAILAARSRVLFQLLYKEILPSHKEKSSKYDKLNKFLKKRCSEPTLRLKPIKDETLQQSSSTIYDIIIIDEFEPDEIQQIVEYIHTGYILLQPRTLLGIMNAADYYGLEELRRVCKDFSKRCINLDTVCTILTTAERFIHYKCTRLFLQKAFEFVDENGVEVLNMGAFTILPQHVVRLILGRNTLKVDELTKFQACLMWAKNYCDNHPGKSLREIMCDLIHSIRFRKISAIILIKDIYPLGVVPYQIIMRALTTQADSTLHEIAKQRSLSVGATPLLINFGENYAEKSRGSTKSINSSDTEDGSGSIHKNMKYLTIDNSFWAKPLRRSSIQ